MAGGVAVTAEEKRIKIAEACGWTDVRMAHQILIGTRPDGAVWMQIPDYLNDLNAMHSAEKGLLFSGRMRFRKELQKKMSEGMDGICLVAIEECIHATAAHRAEAFGRTFNLWTE
jgi:hypothetical protein